MIRPTLFVLLALALSACGAEPAPAPVEPAPVVEPAPAPAPAPDAAAPAAPGMPPRIGHDLEGHDACTTCHVAGGSAPIPANHAAYDVSTCKTCHQPK